MNRDDDALLIGRPHLCPPGPDDHKYTRGLVTVIGGVMPGAAALAALGAAHAGAGYVQMLVREPVYGLPHALVQRRTDLAGSSAILADVRIGAIVVGPGLGSDERDVALAKAALASGRALVVDAGALSHVEMPIGTRAILTPHEGEFARVFTGLTGSRSSRAREAARRSAAVVVLKGSETVVAAPDGRLAVSAPAPPGLATAGTGDVLAGICGTMLAQLDDPFAAACAAVWVHGEAARLLSTPFIADALASPVLGQTVRQCW